MIYFISAVHGRNGGPDAVEGPAMGDVSIMEHEVTYQARSGREYVSRCIDRPALPTRKLTVVAGPSDDGQPCVLYTAYGGAAAPREVADPNLTDAERAAAVEFWSQHAIGIL